MKKNVYLVMCMMFILTFTLSAQRQRMNKARTPQNCEQRMDNRQRGMVTPQMRADRMATELGLSENEKAKVKDLFEKQDANKVTRMDEIQKMKKEMKAKFEGDRKSNEAELERIIGKEKIQKLADKRAEMKSKMADHQKTNHQNRPSSPKMKNREKKEI